jgi:hypothetical protein
MADYSSAWRKYRQLRTQFFLVWAGSLPAIAILGGISEQVFHDGRLSFIPLTMDKTTLQGAVYQGVGKPEYFYVVNGDAMLKLDTKWPYNPGVGGFSMHAPRSRKFIVCLNLDGGVPFLSSSPVQKGKITWKGHDWNTFK